MNRFLSNFLVYMTVLCTIISCDESHIEPQIIVDKSITKYGSTVLENHAVSFLFRNKTYTLKRQGSAYEYQRESIDQNDTIFETYRSNGFYEKRINGVKVAVSQKEVEINKNSINSVAYFFLLPLPLNDPAAIKKSLANQILQNVKYHVVEVSFNEKGGGSDHDDLFVYWINSQTFYIDYLAYRYNTNGGGIRFRKAVNQRKVNGWLTQDYLNYKPIDKKTSLEKLLEHYQNNQLELVSKIENKNIQLFPLF